jgi:hypothetical protein
MSATNLGSKTSKDAGRIERGLPNLVHLGVLVLTGTFVHDAISLGVATTLETYETVDYTSIFLKVFLSLDK